MNNIIFEILKASFNLEILNEIITKDNSFVITLANGKSAKITFNNI